MSFCVSCSSLSFFQTTTLNYFQANLRSPFLWDQLLKNYCVPLVVSGFLDFSCLLESCIAVFAFKEAVTSSSLNWLAFEKKYLLSGLLVILKLFYGYTCSTLLVLSWGRILKILCLLSIPQSQVKCWPLPVYLLPPGQCWMLKFVCFLWIPQSQADFLCMLTSFLQRLTLATISSAPRELATGWRFMWLRCVECWGARGPVGGICRWGGPSGSLTGFLIVCEAVRPIFLWCHLRALAAILSATSCLPVMQHTSVFWMWERRRSFWQHPSQLEELCAYSLALTLPHGRISGWQGLSCHLGGGVIQVKWNCSSYPLQCIQSWIFFFALTVC